MPMNFKGKEYYTVVERLQMLKESNLPHSIETELLSNENGVCIMKATITIQNKDGMNNIYSGHAYEKENSSFINKTSYIENCETSAIGRALASSGFLGGKDFCSANELENAVSDHKQETNVF